MTIPYYTLPFSFGDNRWNKEKQDRHTQVCSLICPIQGFEGSLRFVCRLV